jgi:hypothetical protein
MRFLGPLLYLGADACIACAPYGVNVWNEYPVQCGRPTSELCKLIAAPTVSNTFHYKLEFMPPGRLPLPPNVHVARVIAGFYHTALVTTDGQCYVFGPSSHEPSRPLSEHHTVDVSFGWRHALAIVKK